MKPPCLAFGYIARVNLAEVALLDAAIKQIVVKTNKVIIALEKNALPDIWDDLLDVIQTNRKAFCPGVPESQQRAHYDLVLSNFLSQFGEETLRSLLNELLLSDAQTFGPVTVVSKSVGTKRDLLIALQRALIVDCPWHNWTDEQKAKVVEAIEESF